MYIPDLFGAFMKGKEYANDRNWNDLKQYEAVEAARNANDLSSLDILGQRAQFGGKMSVFQNNVDNSARANEVAEAAQPGLLANAGTNSMIQMDQRSAFMNNRDDYQTMLNNTAQANIGKGIDAAAVQQGANDYLTPERAAQMGGWRGEDSYNTAMSNNITTGHAPTVATQGIVMNDRQYDNNLLGLDYARGELEGNIKRQPVVGAIKDRNAANQYADANTYLTDKAQLAQRENQRQRQGILNTISNLQRQRAAFAADPMMAGQVQELTQQIAEYQAELQRLTGGETADMYIAAPGQAMATVRSLVPGGQVYQQGIAPRPLQGQVIMPPQQPAQPPAQQPQAAPQAAIDPKAHSQNVEAKMAYVADKQAQGMYDPNEVIMIDGVPYTAGQLVYLQNVQPSMTSTVAEGVSMGLLGPVGYASQYLLGTNPAYARQLAAARAAAGG